MFNRPLVAIDIGSSAIKVVELAGQRVKKLRAIGLELLPPGVVVDGAVANPEVATKILRELLRKLKIRTTGRRAALSIGGSSVLIKKVYVAASDADLGEQVYYEAEQNFQASMDEIYWNWCPAGMASGNDVPILLAGAKRDLVEQHLAVVRGVGLRTAVVECGVFSVANMFEYNYGIVEGLTALVNVGAAVTQVSLVAHGEYLYTREIAIGGEEYSRRIVEILGVDRDNAETLKIAVSHGDGNVPPEVQKLLGEINEQLVAEIQVTIDYFFQSGDAAARDSGLACVFLTGGGSRILGLDAALAAALQIPVQILNPFQRVEVNPRRFQLDYISMQGHLYGVAVGLGMRAIGDSA